MEIKTPYHLINTDQLLMNLNGPIAKIRNNASCNILLALKGFSSPQILSFMKDGIDGISASGYNEAILGRKTINKHVCTYSPIYTKETIKTIATYSDNIVFNSIEMFSKYHKIAQDRDCSCGIRINPEYSSLPLNSKTNACRKNSRLGITFENMPSIDLFCKKQIEGIHVHNMCEQFTDSLEETIDYIIDKYDPFLKRIKWLNLGGGQLYAHKEYNIDQAIQIINKLHNLYDFDVYLEPCYGIMINTGFYVTKVIDIVKNGMNIAIVDGSAICHMPDVVFDDWYHEVYGAAEVEKHPYKYQIAGTSCYAGDVWGDYSFENPLEIGSYIIFKDTAAYSIVKSNFFNGLNMPSLATYSKKTGIKILKSYNYEDFYQII